MIRFDRTARLLATTMAALAGFVDAVGFLGSGGFFVSFMSGNSTRLGVGIASQAAAAASAGALIATFVSGVVIASLIKRRLPHGRRQAGVLVVTASALTVACLTTAIAAPFASCLVIAAAMGSINLMFEDEGEVKIGLTYMTGTLVRLGHHLADALCGGDRWTWLPFLTLWFGLAGGAVLGALAFRSLGMGAVWIAAAVAWTLTAAIWRAGAKV